MTDENLVAMMEFEKNLLDNGINYLIGVPCSNFSVMLEFFESNKNNVKLVYVPKENVALGIQAGLWMAGKRSLIFSQNSGVGNMVNGITSFNETYKCPFFAMISHRGHDGKDAPEHDLMGKITRDMLALVGVQCTDYPKFPNFAERCFNRNERIAALVTSKDFFNEKK